MIPVQRTFEIRESGSQCFCRCTVSKAEIIHNDRPIDFAQFVCLTDRSVTLMHNTRLLRSDCDGTFTFTTPGVAGPISLSLCEIESLREDTPALRAKNSPNLTPSVTQTVTVIAASAVGVCLLALAIVFHAFR